MSKISAIAPPQAIPATSPRVGVQTRRLVLSYAPLIGASLITSLGAPTAQAAPSAERLEREYDGYAAAYDDLDGGAAAQALGFPQLRAELLSRASGAVLELGVGTGLNLQYYKASQQLISLTAIDLSEGMLQQARRAARAAGLPVAFQRADVAHLPYADATFDCVVDTFSLCVFPDPAAALREAARVLKPGGRVLLVEHSRSNFPPLGWYQDVTAGAVAATAKGCVWNQDVPALLQAAGLRIHSMDEHLGGLIVSIAAAKL